MSSTDNAGTAATFAADNAKKARIEIIPLIDVIFFLLATFVLFTLSLNKSGGISVKLPATETSEPRQSQGAVTISITTEGTIAWDKEMLTLDEFILRLQAYKQVNPYPQTQITMQISGIPDTAGLGFWCLFKVLHMQFQIGCRLNNCL